MTHAELTRKIKRCGCRFRRTAKGGHEIWWPPQRKLYTVIPRHGKKEMAQGTLHAILKDLNLRLEDLNTL